MNPVTGAWFVTESSLTCLALRGHVTGILDPKTKSCQKTCRNGRNKEKKQDAFGIL